VLNILEADQAEFLRHEDSFRTPGYQWPRDPLHTWSRVWEYPYAYWHLRSRAGMAASTVPPHVVDVGSGVTFFPFSVARLGYQVSCTDVDPTCGRDLSRARGLLLPGPGSIAFRLASERELPFSDGEADAVYCISVVEHVENPEGMIKEIARILKPGGLFVLTVDLDLRGDATLSIASRAAVLRVIGASFAPAWPERSIHPADVLTTETGPYPLRVPKGLLRLRSFLRRRVILPLRGVGARPSVPFRLAVEGFAMLRERPKNETASCV